MSARARAGAAQLEADDAGTGEVVPVKVLVTGASGFIGQALVRRLIAEGITVRATSRGAPPPGVAPLEWRALSHSSTEVAWREAAAGCAAVIHLAGLAHQTGSAASGRSAEFHRINVELTRTLARASLAAGVMRVTFLSSIAAVCSHSEQRVDESSPCEPQDDYGRSKLDAERALESELSGGAVDWCILRPPLIYGPANPGNMARLLRLTASGLPLPLGAIRNRRSFMFIDNLIDAIFTVVTHRGDIRASYIVGDDSEFSTPQLVRAMAAARGEAVRMIAVPVALLKIAGRIGDLAGRTLGIRTALDSYSVDRLTGSLAISSQRFRAAFSWQPPVDVQSAMARTHKVTTARP